METFTVLQHGTEYKGEEDDCRIQQKKIRKKKEIQQCLAPERP